MSRRGLKTRLNKLELTQRGRRFIMSPRLFAVYPDEGVGEIVGIIGNGTKIRRIDGEPMPALIARASAETGCWLFTAQYDTEKIEADSSSQ